jgi:hypothetical protein
MIALGSAFQVKGLGVWCGVVVLDEVVDGLLEHDQRREGWRASGSAG